MSAVDAKAVAQHCAASRAQVTANRRALLTAQSLQQPGLSVPPRRGRAARGHATHAPRPQTVSNGNRLRRAARRLVLLAWVASTVLVTADRPLDPFYPEQWHLANTGQGGGVAGEDIDVEPVWDTLRGSANEVIAIVDDGLELRHEDLAPNIVPGISYNYLNGSNDPTPAWSADSHGTSVAGVAAARGFNGIGVSGVAPEAGLVGFNYLQSQLASDEIDALSRSNQVVDIYNNSWGPADGGYALAAMPALTEAVLAAGVATGRGGLGSIYVWAAGNGYANDNSNYDGYANSRYVIAVAASTNTGAHAVYSEPGANILVNAPSNGGSLGVMTTDLLGSAGCNPGGQRPGCGPNPIANENYTAFFGGTSAAAPIVSGVVALMLQANPALGWRDVRAILARTAEKNSPGDISWTTNGAGHHVSHTLGFGRVNARAAVAAARTWTPLGPEESTGASAIVGVPIPDSPGFNVFGAPVTSGITIADDLQVEFVEVTFSSSDHTYWGDLEIVLRSPSGTESVLAETHASDAGPYRAWRFGSVRHLDERSSGTWTLTVRDGGPRDVGTFDSWSIRIYGTRHVSRVPLTVAVSGTGTVTSEPAGILCGPACSAEFPAASVVTLRAVAGAGAAFAGWRGDADCFDGRVTVAQPASCTAVFLDIGAQPLARGMDLNGDGTGDVLLHRAGSGSWTFALSDRGGLFGFASSVWEAGWEVTPAHLNADRLTDFFLYNRITGTWRQALATGVGTFSYTAGTFSPGWHVWAGRLRGGTIDDLFVYNPEVGGAYHCLVDGAGGFVGYFYQPWSPGWDLHLAELDGDERADVFVYNRTSGRWYSCLNRGPGVFQYVSDVWSPDWTLVTGDFDGNGRDDVFVYNRIWGRWYTCLSRGDGTFAYTPGSWSPGWVIVRGRFNRDPADDLFVYNPASGRWYQCFSDGAGGFARYVGDGWSREWTVEATDLDGDGLDDIFVYNASTGEYFQCLTAEWGHFKSYMRGFTLTGAVVVSGRHVTQR